MVVFEADIFVGQSEDEVEVRCELSRRVKIDEGPCARHASRALHRACGQGAVLSLRMVRPGSGRFGVGFWVGFWVGLRARDFPTERVLSRTPLIIPSGVRSFYKKIYKF